jgi:predicted amidohydrolase
VIIERGKILGTYRKMHLFYREKLWFSKSYSGFKTFRLDSLGCRIGVLICFDWLFPEASRKLALEGAEVICHPSDLVLPGKGQAGMMVRAFENRVFTITANRVGMENRGPKDKFRFTGNSQIVSPEMKRLASAGGREKVAKAAKLDLELARKKFATSMNNIFEDMRTVFY